MKRNTEERIVEMRFENDQFESGVGKTLSSLEKLEEKLKFKGAEDGMSKLESKAKSFSMDSMGSAAESVTNKFSAMEVAGLTAIATIANSATQAAIKIGKKLVDKYFIDPISDGFKEYELLQNTIQTIYTNTKSKGTTIEEIEAGLDDLNKYADDTIYVMSDMTRAIGQFTNAGVNFADSKKAVIGFANLAAAVGATNEQLSRVEYQSSQAMSAGVFRLMDWNSIQNSPLGGEYFQKALIKNAQEYYKSLDSVQKEALGMGDADVKNVLDGFSQMEKGVISFRESFNQKDSFNPEWLRTDIFMKTLEDFADDPELYEAATSVRTFTKMREALEEAAGSGWAETWKIIVGDFGESKALWTDVSKTLSLIIDGVGEARNEILKFWKDVGGRDKVINSLKNAMEALIRILKPVKEAFDEVLSPFLEEYLLRLSEKFEIFTSKLLIGEETASGIKNVFKVLFTIVKWVLFGLEKIADVIRIVVYYSGKLVGDIFQLIGKITGDGNKFTDFWNKIKDTFKNGSFKLPTEKFKEFGDKLQNAGIKIRDFFKNQKVITKDNLINIFTKIVDIGKQIPGAVEKGWTKLKELWETLKESPEFQQLADSLKVLGSALWDLAKALGSKVVELFNQFVDSLKDPEKKAARMETMVNVLNTVVDALKWIAGLATPAINGLKTLFDGIVNGFKKSDSESIENTTNALNEFSEITDKINDNAPRKADSTVTITGSAGLDDKELDNAKKTGEKWKDFYNDFVEAHGGKGIISKNKESSIFEKIFSEDHAYLKKMLAAGGFISVIGLFIATWIGVLRLMRSARKANYAIIENVFKPIKKFFKDGFDLFGLKDFADALRYKDKSERFKDVAIGIALVAGSIALIAKVAQNDPKSMWQAVAIVGGIALVMTGIAVLLGKLKLSNYEGIAKTFLMFGIAVALITASIAGLSYLIAADKDGETGAAIAVVLSLVSILGLLMYLLSESSKNPIDAKDDFWKSFISVAISVYIIIRAISRLASYPAGMIVTAGLTIVAVMGALYAIVKALTKLPAGFDASSIIALGSMMKALGIAILLMGATTALFMWLLNKDPEGLIYGLEIVVNLALGMYALFRVISRKGIDKGSVSAFGVAAILLGVALNALMPAIGLLTLMAHLDWVSLLIAVGSVVALVGGISLALSVASKISNGGDPVDILAFGAAFIAFSFGLRVMAKALADIQSSFLKDERAFMMVVRFLGILFTAFISLTALFASLPKADIGVAILAGLAGVVALFGAALLILSKGAKNFAKALNYFADGLKKLANISGDDLDKIKQNIIKFSENSYEIWVAVAGAFVAGAHVLADAFEEIKPLIEPIIDDLFGIIERKLETSSFGFSLGKTIGDTLLDALAFVVTYLSENSQRIIELTEAAMSVVIKLLVDGVSRALLHLNIISISLTGFGPFTGIVNTLNNFSEYINDYVHTLAGVDFSDAENNLQEGVAGIGDSLDPLTKFNLENPIKFPVMIDFSGVIEETKGAGAELPGQMAEGIESTSEAELPSAGEGMGNNTISGLNGFDSIFGGIAQNMINTFIGKFLNENNLGQVYNATFGLGSTASQGLKDGTGTHSPSKEAIYVANMINKGLIDTLTTSMPEAKMTGYLYASSVVSGITDAAKTANDFAPSITPVLRPDSVTRQLSSIGGVMNATRTMTVATTAKLAAEDAHVMRNAADDMRAMSMYDDSKVVGNIENLGKNIDHLGKSMEGMGFYLDGKKVGKIMTPTVNRGLYVDSIRKGRNN